MTARGGSLPLLTAVWHWLAHTVTRCTVLPGPASRLTICRRARGLLFSLHLPQLSPPTTVHKPLSERFYECWELSIEKGEVDQRV